MMTMLKAAGRSAGDSEECLDCEAEGCAGREAGHSDEDGDYVDDDVEDEDDVEKHNYHAEDGHQ